MTGDDDRFAQSLAEALALVGAYVRADDAAVLDLLSIMRTRHDVVARYTALAQLVATSTKQHNGEANLQELLLTLQLEQANESTDP